MKWRVPFADISFDQEQIDAVTEVLRSGWPSRGKVSAEFEAALGKYLGSNVALVNSGSSALMAALLANGVKAGDTVLVPDFTFVATASVPAMLGCKIVPVDADLETFNIDDERVVVSAHFKAGGPLRQLPKILVTDVAGLPTERFNPDYLIEDAAEALGAEIRGKKLGSFDHLTVFSFQATKQLSTVEGGAIASKDEELIAKCRSVANYGRTEQEYVHDRVGMNMRTTDIASALGLIALKRLDKALDRRQHIADCYRKEIVCVPQKVPSYVSKHANWAFLASGLRDRETAFKEAGIEVKRAWVPVHMQPCFRGLPTDYPNATWLYSNLLMLPCFDGMTNEQVQLVIDTAT